MRQELDFSQKYFLYLPAVYNKGSKIELKFSI
jgi:hypothetical protein